MRWIKSLSFITIAILILVIISHIGARYFRPKKKHRICQIENSSNKDLEYSHIFTGTVNRIIRASSSVHYKAVVKVKRVLRGSREIEDKSVVIHGFGNEKMCKSDVRDRDTRIFVVNLMPNASYLLASSLFRINLRNLRHLSQLTSPQKDSGNNSKSSSSGPLSFSEPSFNGSSFLKLGALDGYNKFSIDLRFRPSSTGNCLLLYNGAQDGFGDFFSLSIIDGFLDFRYNLGSGTSILKSSERIHIDGSEVHVIAQRYYKDGRLSVDGQEEVRGSSKGSMKSLDTKGHLYLGLFPVFIKNSWRTLQNVGTLNGFKGCITKLSLNGKRMDLSYPSENRYIVDQINVSQCKRKKELFKRFKSDRSSRNHLASYRHRYRHHFNRRPRVIPPRKSFLINI